MVDSLILVLVTSVGAALTGRGAPWPWRPWSQAQVNMNIFRFSENEK